MKKFKFRVNLIILVLILCTSLVGQETPKLQILSSFKTGIFDEKASEIAAYDSFGKQLFVVNVSASAIDILDISSPNNINKIGEIDISIFDSGNPNSVAVHNNVLAVAIEADSAQLPGKVLFYNTFGQFLHELEVGAVPDMITFTPDGQYVLVANEGEPDDFYINDPEGSISIIRINNGDVCNTTISSADFSAYRGQEQLLRNRGVRIFGPNADVSKDLEPEYIAITEDSRTAYVTLQENNAIGVIDIENAIVTDILPLGFKDHNLEGNGLDASDDDNQINIQTWPLFGMYQPDAISVYSHNGQSYLVTANEGSERDYPDADFEEPIRVEDVLLDSINFPDFEILQDDENLGRIQVTSFLGDNDGDSYFDSLFVFGARSFSIWNTQGQLLYDSGDKFEQLIKSHFPDYFNSDNDDNDSFDRRSDNSGPEPAGITLGTVDNKTYAFIGLSRMGGIMVYDITDPHNPAHVEYVNNRDFDGNPEIGTAGDLGPEGILFIPAINSPKGLDLLVVSNEVSGSVTVYSFSEPSEDIPESVNPSSDSTVALSFHLEQNFPNPFNSRTRINYSLESDSRLAIVVYNLLGQELVTLVSGLQTAGKHSVEFNGEDRDGVQLSSGIYIYQMATDFNVQTKKLLLIR